jgi:hypothetical protein
VALWEVLLDFIEGVHQGPSAPRLDPLVSPGPVTPLALEAGDYLAPRLARRWRLGSGIVGGTARLIYGRMEPGQAAEMEVQQGCVPIIHLTTPRLPRQ